MRVLMYMRCEAIAMNSLATSMSMRFALVEPGKVLLENGGDVHVLNFDFIFAEQQEDDVQRAVEIFEGLGLARTTLSRWYTGSFIQTVNQEGYGGKRPFSKPVRRKFSGVSSTSANRQNVEQDHAVALVAHEPCVGGVRQEGEEAPCCRRAGESG